jgi:hypothetical protein
MNNTEWKETVVLVDAEYVDHVAFDLTVNFERMLGRRIPQADTARWLECVALDGGLRPQPTDVSLQTAIQVVLIYGREQQKMANFQPGDFDALDGKAFGSGLSEFLLSCVKVEEMVSKEDLYMDSLRVLANAKEVKRLLVVADMEQAAGRVKDALRDADPEKHITLLTMDPTAAGGFRQELLGYSLMAALGIRGEEINSKL